MFGTPDSISLASLGCNCTLGLSGAIFAPNPLVINVPPAPALVASISSVQGYGFSGANCLGFLDLTDTIDFFIR